MQSTTFHSRASSKTSPPYFSIVCVNMSFVNAMMQIFLLVNTFQTSELFSFQSSIYGNFTDSLTYVSFAKSNNSASNTATELMSNEEMLHREEDWLILGMPSFLVVPLCTPSNFLLHYFATSYVMFSCIISYLLHRRIVRGVTKTFTFRQRRQILFAAYAIPIIFVSMPLLFPRFFFVGIDPASWKDDEAVDMCYMFRRALSSMLKSESNQSNQPDSGEHEILSRMVLFLFFPSIAAVLFNFYILMVVKIFIFSSKRRLTPNHARGKFGHDDDETSSTESSYQKQAIASQNVGSLELEVDGEEIIPISNESYDDHFPSLLSNNSSLIVKRRVASVSYGTASNHRIEHERAQPKPDISKANFLGISFRNFGVLAKNKDEIQHAQGLQTTGSEERSLQLKSNAIYSMYLANFSIYPSVMMICWLAGGLCVLIDSTIHNYVAIDKKHLVVMTGIMHLANLGMASTGFLNAVILVKRNPHLIRRWCQIFSDSAEYQPYDDLLDFVGNEDTCLHLEGHDWQYLHHDWDAKIADDENWRPHAEEFF